MSEDDYRFDVEDDAAGLCRPDVVRMSEWDVSIAVVGEGFFWVLSRLMKRAESGNAPTFAIAAERAEQAFNSAFERAIDDAHRAARS